METSADQAICNLIETLASRASKWTCDDDDRQTYINQIAQLRSSMNPVIVQKVKKD